MQLRRCVLVGVVAMAAGGCLRRIEIIDVRPDGSVELTTRIEGDVEDVRTGSAMPSHAGGWSVEEKEEKEGERTKLVITARQKVARAAPGGGEIPETYATAGSETAGLDVRFTTSVRVERRSDGTYYHFERRYQPRRWAQLNYYHETLIKTGDVRVLAEKDPKELKEHEREQLAQKLIEVEAHKTMELLSAAGADLPPEAVQSAQMRAFSIYADPKITADIVGLLGGDVEGEAVERVEEHILQDVRRVVEEALAGAGVSQQAIRAYFERYDRARLEYGLSEDLADDHWLVAVRMPGRIIAHNVFAEESQPSDLPQSGAEFVEAVMADDDFPRGPDRCGWAFEGPALYDREVVLRATSFVAAEQGR